MATLSRELTWRAGFTRHINGTNTLVIGASSQMPLRELALLVARAKKKKRKKKGEKRPRRLSVIAFGNDIPRNADRPVVDSLSEEATSPSPPVSDRSRANWARRQFVEEHLEEPTKHEDREVRCSERLQAQRNATTRKIEMVQRRLEQVVRQFGK